VWRRGPTDQDLDQPAGTVEVDLAMTQQINGAMNHTLNPVKRCFQPGASGKINAGTPARRAHRYAASFESLY
jgi:hypothetical protein